MNLNRLGYLVVTISILMVFQSCECEKPKNERFSGKVISVSGDPVVGAEVIINESKTETDESGSFEINARLNSSNYLVAVQKFGFGLYSQLYNSGFKEKTIVLTEGTIVEFDPAVDNTITDTNAGNNIMQSSLSNLDTSQLFSVIPKVYDHTGKLIDLGYPEGLENIFDYVKQPITQRRGMSLRLRGNSLRSSSGNAPPTGTRLRAAVTTVDFFNPDGMPGDFVVRYQGDPRRFELEDSLSNSDKTRIKSIDSKENMSTDEENEYQYAYMESFGAATIEITDGTESYNLKEGETATVTIPIYEIRQNLGEKPPSSIPLLHYNELNGFWEVTGTGYLNETADAYVGEVRHFSVVNFDLIKTGDSKCFKIRQMLVNGANDNTSTGGGGVLSTFRTTLIVPPTATTVFRERFRDIDESTGCVSIEGTSLHGVTRIPNDISYIAAIFSQSGVGGTDTLDIAFISPDPIQSIPAETAVGSAGDCTTATCDAADLANCESTNDAVDMANFNSSNCNSCWLPECPVIPFDNSGADRRAIVAIPMGGGDVVVKWVHDNPGIQSLKVTVHNTSCANPEIGTIQDLCAAGCLGNACNGGSIIYSGTVGSTVYFNLNVYNTTLLCDDIPLDGGTCSGPVTIL